MYADVWTDNSVYGWDFIMIPTYDPPYILFDTYLDISFALGEYDPSTVPVTLSSFTACQTASNFVALEWVTQSETDMLGYNILRSDSNDITQAVFVSGDMIEALNQPVETVYKYTDIDVDIGSEYWYWLESVESTGQTGKHGPVNVMLTGDGGEGGDTPDVVWVTALENNFPNPFNPSTSVVYTLAEESDVDIAVYNMRGQLIRNLHDHQFEGRHRLVWDGLNHQGEACASGVYFFHLHAGGETDIIRGMLIK